MHPLIKKLLQKRGIEEVSSLDSEEKKDFVRWEATLSEGIITVARIQEFCKIQTDLIENKFKDITLPVEIRQRLIDQFNVYRSILELITKPESEREALEKYLNSLIENIE